MACQHLQQVNKNTNVGVRLIVRTREKRKPGRRERRGGLRLEKRSGDDKANQERKKYGEERTTQAEQSMSIGRQKRKREIIRQMELAERRERK